jgi:hypothetical protein
MHVLIVYESLFGNTREVAEAIAEGLRDGAAGEVGAGSPDPSATARSARSAGAGPDLDVDLVEVGAAPTVLPDDLDLLVVGGPTHAFGRSRVSTRRSAVEQGAHPTDPQGIGVREWLDAVHRSATGGARAATFDTHIAKPRLPGAASHAVAKRLRRDGFELVVPAENFDVDDVEGPLLPGERDRARRWGAALRGALAA